MPSLAEVQASLAEALLGAGRSDVAAMVAGDGVAPEARVDIYRHHVLASLTTALLSTYPVVRRLVGDGFFGYVAHHFITARPPTGPCLFEYGEALADFLERLPACGDLPYVGDVARLEWALNHALHAEDAVPLDLDALRSLDPAHVDGLTLRFAPSVTLLSSPWPIDTIWSANQVDADPEATVDASRGPVQLQISRRGDDVVFRRLAPAAYTFRRILLEGGGLSRAASEAARVDAAFDVIAALHELFTEDVLTSPPDTSGPGEPV